MKNTVMSLLLAFVLLNSLICQSIEYEKYFGYDFNVEAESVLYLSDGNYLLSGFAKDEVGSKSIDILTVLIDYQGNVLRTNIYGDTLNNHVSSSLETKRGNVVFAGYKLCRGGGTKFLIFSISNEGDSLWMKSFGQGLTNSANKIIETRDEHLVMVGSIKNDSSSRRASISKLTKDGVLVWEKIIGESLSENVALDIIELEVGGFLISGWTKNSTTNGYLIRTDEDGKILWDNKFTGSNSSSFTDIELSNDGNVLVGGHKKGPSFSDLTIPILLKMNIDGYILWQKEYTDMMNNGWGARIRQDESSNIFLLGNTEREQSVSLWLIKLDRFGNEIYREFYGDQSSNWVRGFSTLETNSFGIFTNSYLLNQDSSQREGVLYFIKVKDGNLTGTENGFGSSSISIYPNPCVNSISIGVEDFQDICWVVINNNLGKQVYSNQADMSHPTIINMENYSPGLYCVSVIMKSTNKVYSKMINLQR